MSATRKTLSTEKTVRTNAGKVPASSVKAPVDTGRLAGVKKPIDKAIGGKGKGRGPVYEVPKPVRPRTVKK